MNRVGIASRSLLVQSPVTRAVRGLKSKGTLLGLTTNLFLDGKAFIEGRSDRHEFAAALTVDTGITVGTTLAAGFVAGMVTGAVSGGLAANVALPLVGTVPGAVIGGIVGGVVGAAVAIGISYTLEEAGTRQLLVEKVADLFRSWEFTH